MTFERQKPVSEQYRENWERTFTKQATIYKERARAIEVPKYYDNGCPMIEESNA